MQTFTVQIKANSIDQCWKIDSRLSRFDGGSAVIDSAQGTSLTAIVRVNTIDTVSETELRSALNDQLNNPDHTATIGEITED